MRRILLILTLAAAACVPIAVTSGTGPTPITNGDQLLTAMHSRYAGRWYRSIQFVQKSTYYRPDGSILRSETWYEAGVMPGKLRIDMNELSRGNGVLYRNDSTYQVQGGRVTARRFAGNELLTLGFDVYAQPTYQTAEQLRRYGFNLATLHTDTLDGRRVYVVGAARGDSTTNQFWIDAERLLFVRALLTQDGNTRDVRFERYTQYDGGWVAETVRVIVGGRLRFLEEYSQTRVNVQLNDDLFLPERWSTALHWYRP